ncbi:MAG: glycosyltransferase family 4 protein [Flavobacteriales bacterium]|nr:glycosyltransferase family 4 protein [Flavobacteriales bacterium]
MRVIHITHYADLYGANRSLLDLLDAFQSNGSVIPTVLLPAEGPMCEALRTRGLPFSIIPFRPWMTARHFEGGAHHRLMQYLRYRGDARENARLNEGFAGTALALASSLRADLIHINSLAVGIGRYLTEVSSLPTVWHAREMPERQYGLHLDQGRRTYAAALASATRIIANSEATKIDVQRYIGSDKRVDVIHNGVFSLPQYDQWQVDPQARSMHAGPFTFLLVGVVHPSKGQEEAVRAMALVKDRYPEARLVLVGSGNVKPLQELMNSLDLNGNVDILGHRPNVDALYAKAQALLMCSRNEAFGRVTVEAMAHGVPVIARAEAGTLEVLDHGRQGLLYQNGHEQLAQRMMSLIADPEAARSLGQRGRVHVRGLFNSELCSERVTAVFQAVAAGRAQRASEHRATDHP